MYRSCKCNKCSISNYSNTSCPNNTIETLCSNVNNSVTDYADDCGCGFDEDMLFPKNPMFGQSYVPWQTMDKTFTPQVGLKMGTIFPELVSPYMPNQSVELNAYIEATNKIKEGCNKC